MRGIRAGSAALLFFPAALAFMGCEESGTGPDYTDFEGVSLTFEGSALWETHQSPTFTDGQVDPGPFTMAFPDSVGGWVIGGFLPTQSPAGDLFILQLTERRTGTFSPCSPNEDCHGRMLEGIDPNDLEAGATYWEIVSGSVTVDGTGDGRLRGFFTDLVFQQADSEETRTATEGGFNVELLSDAEGVAIMRCFIERMTGGSC